MAAVSLAPQSTCRTAIQQERTPPEDQWGPMIAKFQQEREISLALIRRLNGRVNELTQQRDGEQKEHIERVQRLEGQLFQESIERTTKARQLVDVQQKLVESTEKNLAQIAELQKLRAHDGQYIKILEAQIAALRNQTIAQTAQLELNRAQIEVLTAQFEAERKRSNQLQVEIHQLGKTVQQQNVTIQHLGQQILNRLDAQPKGILDGTKAVIDSWVDQLSLWFTS